MSEFTPQKWSLNTKIDEFLLKDRFPQKWLSSRRANEDLIAATAFVTLHLQLIVTLDSRVYHKNTFVSEIE